MSAGDLVAVLAGIVGLASFGVAVFVIMSLRQSVRELEVTLAEIHEQIVPAADSLVTTAQQLADEAYRANGLLDTLDQIAARSDVVSKATYRAIAEPVIKTASILKGTSRVARKLRGAGEPDDQKNRTR